MSNIEIAKEIAKRVSEKGGQAYYVGGYVRDTLMGKVNKDIDLEIYGIPEDELKNILKDVSGNEVSLVGKSFGVYKLNGLDIALPRKEIKTGNKHTDFKVIVDPFMSPKEALKRRDFTMNAILASVLTNDIIDPYNGINDIADKVIRCVDKNTFIEDPLRVYRAAQFAARFDFELDRDLVELCKKIDLSSLSEERVYEEMKKALLKASVDIKDVDAVSSVNYASLSTEEKMIKNNIFSHKGPAKFFWTLKELDQLKTHFKEIDDLIDCPQNPKYHPEGLECNAFEHTMVALNKASSCCNNIDKNHIMDKECFMIGALCHDLGKPITSKYNEEKGRWTNWDHDKAGVEITKEFLRRLKASNKVINYAATMTAEHMKLYNLFNNRQFSPYISNPDLSFSADTMSAKQKKSSRKVLDGLSNLLDEISFTCVCDSAKGGMEDITKIKILTECVLDYSNRIKEMNKTPLIFSDIERFGYVGPVNMIRDVLKEIRKQWLVHDISKDEAIKMVVGSSKYKEYWDSHEEINKDTNEDIDEEEEWEIGN